MPAQDRVRSDHAAEQQCAGQPPHERGQHGSVRPVQARTWIGAAQYGDLVAQHEELDVLRGGRAGQEYDQPEYLPEDQIEQPQRHSGIMSDQRSPLVSDPGPTSGTPHRKGCNVRPRPTSRSQRVCPARARPGDRPAHSVAVGAASRAGHHRMGDPDDASPTGPRRPHRRVEPGRALVARLAPRHDAAMSTSCWHVIG